MSDKVKEHSFAYIKRKRVLHYLVYAYYVYSNANSSMEMS